MHKDLLVDLGMEKLHEKCFTTDSDMLCIADTLHKVIKKVYKV